MASFILKNYCSWDTNLASRWISEHLKRYLPINQRKSLPNVRTSHSSTSQMFLQVLTCTIFYPHDICMERDSDGWNHETWLIFPWGVLLTLRFDLAKPAKRQDKKDLWILRSYLGILYDCLSWSHFHLFGHVHLVSWKMMIQYLRSPSSVQLGLVQPTT